jgi:carboxyl-terminal processing protease
MTLRRKITIALSALVVASTALIFSAFKPGSDLFEISKNIDIFTSVYKELNTYYVDDIDPNKAMRTGIDAMLESLDPYTNYISEAEMEGYKFQITGNYGGIGASIRKIDDKYTVTDLFEGFPAQKAGLKTGDILISVDGYEVDGLDEGLSDLMKGSPGSPISLVIERPYSEGRLTFTFEREEINTGNVPYYGMVNDRYGYIILSQFTEDAGRNVESAFRSLKEEHPGMEGVILDLRSNPGGLLREAVNVSNIFIEKGMEVVSTRSRIEDWDKTFLTINPPVDTDIPLVVLTDRASASASEIVAGVIQDYDRGVIVGQKTFGKGLVQTTRDISYKTKLKLTTAKYYIPSGRCIQAINYAQRNEDGSVASIPDSLKVPFKTSAGRTVYDGGGIDPDLALEESVYSDITISLLRGNHIFHFSTMYLAENGPVADARNFSITEEDYARVLSFMEDRDYSYTTITEEMIDELEATSREDNRFESMEEHINTLREEIAADKAKDLNRYKYEIIYEINKEIAGRDHYFSGRVEASFNQDPDISEAIRILGDPVSYKALLTNQ